MSRTGTKQFVGDPVELGAAIRDARKAHGLTQADLAGLAGTGVRLVSELERGKPGVQVGKMLDILAALGLRLRLDGPGP
jgi:HTH-type transcriptional regulator / antitoxin HipB